MTKQSIIQFLTRYKHKDNEIVNYSTMNNIADQKTLTDTKNIIATAVKNKDIKFLTDMIKAIYNVKGDVFYDVIKKNYILLEKRGSTVIRSDTVKIELVGNLIKISLNNNKRSLSFELPKKIEKDFKKIKADIIKELQKETIKSKEDFKKFVDGILNTKF